MTYETEEMPNGTLVFRGWIKFGERDAFNTIINDTAIQDFDNIQAISIETLSPIEAAIAEMREAQEGDTE